MPEEKCAYNDLTKFVLLIMFSMGMNLDGKDTMNIVKRWNKYMRDLNYICTPDKLEQIVVLPGWRNW